jgi:hypothetical protein
MPFELTRLNVHTWNTFVRPQVRLKTFPSTRGILQAILPYFPADCRCIGGYLDDGDQFWKVSYHWELLLRMLRKAATYEPAPRSKMQIAQMTEELLKNPPNPDHGYVDSQVLGQPHDKSPPERLLARWRTLRHLKTEFRAVLDLEQIPKKHPMGATWDLAVAPIARPGTSKHGCGYALDIAGPGQNARIKSIANALFATMAFDEKSHVHVEFKQGVILGGRYVTDDRHDGQWAGWKQTGTSATRLA